MNISLNERDRYTTQSRVWDMHILGPLTNADIKRYNKMGKSLSHRREEHKRKLLSELPWHFKRGPKVEHKPRRNILKELLA